MDIIGPLPRSRAGHRYVLVVCDDATRYLEAVPLRTIDTEAIAEELVKIFSRLGIPHEILTDQGSNFTSQLLVEIYRLLRVNAIRTSPYHLRQTGMLRKTACEDGKDWDRFIPYVQFAFQEVPQETIGYLRDKQTSMFLAVCGSTTFELAKSLVQPDTLADTSFTDILGASLCFRTVTCHSKIQV
uniref:Integrase catalytic domain-containing protein n=1 Tax=Amphimedon queenslandica TaxID=400682 RepID=A0A1X7TMS1_AMPQE